MAKSQHRVRQIYMSPKHYFKRFKKIKNELLR